MSRALIGDLPKYAVCSVRELLSASDSPHSTMPAADRPHRRIVKLPNKREIMVVMHPLTFEVFAMDRFCYHVGYPLDTGDIEDIPVKEWMPAQNDTADSDDSVEKKEQQQEQQQLVSKRKHVGGLGFTKEEQIKQMAKALQQQQQKQRDVGGGASSAAPSILVEDLDALVKLVRPGTLEADYDDPSKLFGDDTYEFPIVTCKLHNRIFDLRTGDMITRFVEEVADAEAAGNKKKRKILVSESTGCHQRIHPVTIESAVSGGDHDEFSDGVIFVHDTFGHSTPTRRPGVPIDMKARSHLMFLSKKKVMSDKENNASEGTVANKE